MCRRCGCQDYEDMRDDDGYDEPDPVEIDYPDSDREDE